jgi:hypothetical protein
MIEPTLNLGRAFGPRQNTARRIDHSHCYLGTANVNAADHVAFSISSLAVQIVLNCFIKTYE